MSLKNKIAQKVVEYLLREEDRWGNNKFTQDVSNNLSIQLSREPFPFDRNKVLELCQEHIVRDTARSISDSFRFDESSEIKRQTLNLVAEKLSNLIVEKYKNEIMDSISKEEIIEQIEKGIKEKIKGVL